MVFDSGDQLVGCISISIIPFGSAQDGTAGR